MLFSISLAALELGQFCFNSVKIQPERYLNIKLDFTSTSLITPEIPSSLFVTDSTSQRVISLSLSWTWPAKLFLNSNLFLEPSFTEKYLITKIRNEQTILGGGPDTKDDFLRAALVFTT